MQPGDPTSASVSRRFVRGQKGLTSAAISALTLSFLSLFFWKMARKTTQKTRIFYSYRTPKIPGKEGKNAQKNKEFLARGKNKEFQKNKERKDRVAHRNRSDFCDLRLRCPSRTPEIARFPRQETTMPHCDLRVRWKVASDLRFRAAISEPKTPSFCGISGDLAQSTRKSLAIAMVRFWCAKFPQRMAVVSFYVFFFVFLWSESATTLRQDWTNTCVLEPCKNDASEREERKSPNPGKRSAKRSVRVYAANCDCVTCLSKKRTHNAKKSHEQRQRIF